MIATLRKCGMYALISTCLFYSNGSQLFFHSFSFIFRPPKFLRLRKTFYIRPEKKVKLNFLTTFSTQFMCLQSATKKCWNIKKFWWRHQSNSKMMFWCNVFWSSIMVEWPFFIRLLQQQQHQQHMLPWKKKISVK